MTSEFESVNNQEGGDAASAPQPEPSGDNAGPSVQPSPNQIVLAEDGSNFMLWQTMVPVYLKQEPYAWEVVNGTLTAVGPQDQQDKFDTGNRMGRLILLNVIHPRIMVGTFMTETAPNIPASQIWQKIRERFTRRTTVRKLRAMLALRDYRYDSSRSVYDNIDRFRVIVYRVRAAKVGLKDDVLWATLVNALPDDWEDIRQSWVSRPDDDKSLGSLFELILYEAAMRENAKKKCSYTVDVFTIYTSDQQSTTTSTRPSPAAAALIASTKSVFG